MSKKYRIETDALGEIEVPKDAYWGISTQRAIENFKISGKKFPYSFIIALAQVKKACLLSNLKLELIDKDIAKALLQAIEEIIETREFKDQFPIDIYQTGSGTQTNMNMNEVLANRANEILGQSKGKKTPVHPNDHVNKGQSSNDVIPTAMHLVTLELFRNTLYPELEKIIETLETKIDEFKGIIKVGRTHLQDAVPIPLSLEFSVYKELLEKNVARLKKSEEELYLLPIGGTAVGTGLNTSKEFAEIGIAKLTKLTGFPFQSNPIKAEGIASHNVFTYVSGILRSLALALHKMANDIRWMGSGPRAGLGELKLPRNEPGSSIMPGKINPTQAEQLIQVCAQIIGYDSSINFAEGNNSILDLNMAKPLIITNIIDSIFLLSNSINSFNENCLKGLKVNKDEIQSQLEQNLMNVTALAKKIGYDKASEIAVKAHETGKTIKEITKKSDLNLSEEEIDELLDPRNLV